MCLFACLLQVFVSIKCVINLKTVLLVNFSLSNLAGVGKAACVPGAGLCHCEDCKVRGGQSSRSGKGAEAPQR